GGVLLHGRRSERGCHRLHGGGRSEIGRASGRADEHPQRRRADRRQRRRRLRRAVLARLTRRTDRSQLQRHGQRRRPGRLRQHTHTDPEELNAQPFSVTVTDNVQTASASTTTFSVADAALTAGALTPPSALTEADAITDQIVFSFTDADPNAAVTDYTAVVDP